MLLKSIRIENFKSYHNTLIDFSEGFDPKSNKNIFLVGGALGAGKSSLLEAIRFCLYGFKTEKTKGNFEKMDPIEIKKLIIQKPLTSDISLTLELDDEEGNIIKINRKYGTNYGEKLSIFKNEIEIDFNSDDKEIDKQNYIDDIIPEGASQFFFFAGEQIQKYSGEVNSEVLKDAIDKVLGIQKFTDLKEDIEGVRRQNLKNMKKELNEKELKEMEDKKSKLEAEISKYDTNITELDSEISRLQTAVDSKELIMNELINEESLEKQNRITEQIISYDKQSSEIESELTQRKEFLPYSLINPYLSTLENDIRNARDLRGSTLGNELIDKVIDCLYKPREIISNVERDDDNYDIIYKKLKTVFGTNNNSNDFVLDISDQQEQKLLILIEKIKQNCKLNVSEKFEQLKGIEIEKGKLEYQRNNTLSADKFSVYKKTEKEKEELQQKLSTRKERQLEFLKKKQKLKPELEKITKEIEDFVIQRNKKQDYETLNKTCEVYIEVLGKYIETLRKKKLGETEERINIMLHKSHSQTDRIGKIKIDPQTYEIIVYDNEGNKIDKNPLSDGEKTIFSLCLIWGLAKTTELNCPIVIDAPLNELDLEHQDSILEKYLPEAAKQLVMLTNDSQLNKDKVNKIYTYTYNQKTLQKQKDGTSRLVDGYFGLFTSSKE